MSSGTGFAARANHAAFLSSSVLPGRNGRCAASMRLPSVSIAAGELEERLDAPERLEQRGEPGLGGGRRASRSRGRSRTCGLAAGRAGITSRRYRGATSCRCTAVRHPAHRRRHGLRMILGATRWSRFAGRRPARDARAGTACARSRALVARNPAVIARAARAPRRSLNCAGASVAMGFRPRLKARLRRGRRAESGSPRSPRAARREDAPRLRRRARTRRSSRRSRRTSRRTSASRRPCAHSCPGGRPSCARPASSRRSPRCSRSRAAGGSPTSAPARRARTRSTSTTSRRSSPSSRSTAPRPAAGRRQAARRILTRRQIFEMIAREQAASRARQARAHDHARPDLAQSRAGAVAAALRASAHRPVRHVRRRARALGQRRPAARDLARLADYLAGRRVTGSAWHSRLRRPRRSRSRGGPAPARHRGDDARRPRRRRAGVRSGASRAVVRRGRGRVDITFLDGRRATCTCARGHAAQARGRALRGSPRRNWEQLRPCVVIDTVVGSRVVGVLGRRLRRGSPRRISCSTVSVAHGIGGSAARSRVASTARTATGEIGKAINKRCAPIRTRSGLLFAAPQVLDDAFGAGARRDARAAASRRRSTARSGATRCRSSTGSSTTSASPSTAPRSPAGCATIPSSRSTPPPRASRPPRGSPRRRSAAKIARARDYIKQLLHRSLYDQGVIARDLSGARLRAALTADPRRARDAARPPPEERVQLDPSARSRDPLARRRAARRSALSPAIRPTLLAIKKGELPMTDVMALARERRRGSEAARATKPLPKTMTSRAPSAITACSTRRRPRDAGPHATHRRGARPGMRRPPEARFDD